MSKPQTSPCLYLLSPRTASVYHHAQLFLWVLGIQLRLAKALPPVTQTWVEVFTSKLTIFFNAIVISNTLSHTFAYQLE